MNHRIVVPEATREAFLQQLCASSAFLLSSLEQIAAGPLGAEVMVQVCVWVWVCVHSNRRRGLGSRCCGFARLVDI